MIALLLLALILMAVAGVVDRHRQRSRRTKADIARSLYRADGQIQREYRRARRHMNDAAGQSWRNLVDDGRD